jgi:periplasmic protein TonB
MRRRRGLATLGASLVLHGGVLLAILLAVSGESDLSALFIDLTESAQAGDASGPAGRSAPGPAGRVSARGLHASAPARSAPMPSASLGSSEPLPGAEPASPRDPVAESPAPESPALPPRAAARPVEASQPDPTPRATEAPDASGASGAGASSAASAPRASVSESGVFTGRGVSGGGSSGAPDVSQGFALAAPGGGGAGGPGAEYGAYLGRLRARVQESLRYPLAARRRGLSGTVHVEIVIRADGVIGEVAVADSSSHPVLDDAAVETIKRLVPEPFPPDVRPRTLRVRLPVVFALE